MERSCTKHNIPFHIVNIAMLGKRATTETMKRSIIDELKRTISIINNLKKEIKTFIPDIIHINTSCSFPGIVRDALCVFISKKIASTVPIVLHCRCNITDQVKNKLEKFFFTFMVKNANTIIVLNKRSLKCVEEIKEGYSCIIPNFINEEMICEKHNINKQIVNVLTIGHVERAKGIQEIFEVASQRLELRFTVVGAVRENISSLLQISKNVNVVGRVSLEKIQDYLDNADVFLFPSKTEGFSNALLEAMARGLPIIASDVGANADMIEKDGGIILRQNTSKEISQALYCLSDKNLRAAMSKWNINKVKKCYSINVVMNQYFELYEALQSKGEVSFYE